MTDRRQGDRRQGDRRASNASSTATSVFTVGTSYLIIPKDLTKDFHPCRANVVELHEDGAWLELEKPEFKFPEQKDLLLIQFDERWVHTHHCEAIRRQNNRMLIDAPSVTERERSQLAPSTGRFDYRIRVNLPVRIKDAKQISNDDVAPRLGRLLDLSRGGMGLLMPASQEFKRDQRLVIRVVGWDYPVSIHAVVQRVSDAEERGKKKLALIFPEDLTIKQRESISSFIIQVQRRDALLRAVPTNPEDV